GNAAMAAASASSGVPRDVCRINTTSSNAPASTVVPLAARKRSWLPRKTPSTVFQIDCLLMSRACEFAVAIQPERKRYGNAPRPARSEEHTSELQSRGHLVCRLLLEKKKHRVNVELWLSVHASCGAWVL